MIRRRSFLTGLAAAGAFSNVSWAETGNPAFLSVARAADNTFGLYGLSAAGEILFKVPLAGRGHAAAAHPDRAEAVAFARRPGTFAHVLDCATGTALAELTAPDGRHFYGHGTFSSDGSILYTTENDYEAARGIVGLWDTSNGYRRLGEFSSGGVGPHDIQRLPNSETLVIANGGIETHPDSGRTKLNIPMMRPNLSYLSATGELLEAVKPVEAQRLNSIRHLAIASDGTVALAAQWQGDSASAPPLLALHKTGAAMRPLAAPPEVHRELHGYAGSVTFSGDGKQIAITSPRGGVIQKFDVASETFVSSQPLEDVCGIAPNQNGMLVTSGKGIVAQSAHDRLQNLSAADLQWDNHLIAIG